MKTFPDKSSRIFFSLIVVLSFTCMHAEQAYAQGSMQSNSGEKVAALHNPAPEASDADASGAKTPAVDGTATAAAPEASAEVLKELTAMKARIEQLEAELKSRTGATQPDGVAAGVATKSESTTENPDRANAEPVTSAAAQTSSDSAATGTTKQPPAEPFAYADWTWLNGTARTKDAVWDSKFFTPEIRLDTDFISSFNHPKDD